MNDVRSLNINQKLLIISRSLQIFLRNEIINLLLILRNLANCNTDKIIQVRVEDELTIDMFLPILRNFCIAIYFRST